VKNTRPSTLSAYRNIDLEGKVIFFMTAPWENAITIILARGKGEVKEMFGTAGNLILRIFLGQYFPQNTLVSFIFSG
jgi:hypothetical protein